MIQLPLIRRIVQSTSLDIFGALLIFSVCYFRNFHGTVFEDGQLEFGIPFNELWGRIANGAYPLGVASTLGAIFSMLATRFVSKQKNSGNMIGIVTTVNSGANDFLFGNASAIITYPITFITHSVAYKKWADGEKIKGRDKRYYLIICVAMIIAFALVHLGAYLFGGKTDGNFLLIVSLTFGLSLGATISNVFKYEDTWLSWSIYNVVQLVKNSMLMNMANVVKYVFYLFNAGLTLMDWRYNGDAVKSTKA